MNKLELLVGDNFCDVERNIIEKIDVKNFEKKNIVFVPSISSRNVVQQKIFDVLNIKATMNVEITTIQNFLIKNLCDENKEKLLSDVQEHLFVKQAIKNVQSKLKVFNKDISNGLVENVLTEINRFYDSEISIETLKKQNVHNEMLKNKINDLILIFEEYENLIKNKINLNKLLKNKEKIKNKFKNYNFYFFNYLKLNKNEINFIKFIAENSDYCCFGVCENENNDNDYIFNLNLKKQLATLQDENLQVEIINVKNTQNENQKLLNDNLFSVASGNHNKNFSNFLQVFEAIDCKTEVENVARIIKSLIVEKKANSLTDFAILCSDIEKYKPEIENVFIEYNFSIYFDCGGEKITNLQITNFVTNIFEFLATKKFEYFVNIALSNFSTLTQKEETNLIDFLQKNEVSKIEDFLTNNLFNSSIKKLNNILLEFENLLPSEVVEKVIQGFNIFDKIKSLQVSNNFEIANAMNNAFEKMQNLCLQLESNFEKNNWQNFVDDFKFFVENISINLNTHFVDSIYVGSVQNAENICPKFLFVLGSNEGALPSQNNDTAILTDDDLKTLGSDFENVLTVREINRLARLQVFKALTNFEEKIYISYSLSDASGQKLLPSGFIESLNNFSNKILTKNLMHLGGNELDEKSLQEKANYWAKIFGTKHNAKLEILKNNVSENLDLVELMPSLEKALNFEKNNNEKEQVLCDIKGLCFGKDYKTKVSQIESYYSCPFKHFMQYGLKLREVENCKLENKHFGQILHSVAELFLKQENCYLQKIENGEKIEDIIENIFNDLKSQNKYEKLFFESNKFSLKIVKEEALRLCKHLFESIKKSSFKPKYLEVYFGRDNNKFEMQVLNTNFSLVGVVDRVDVCENDDIIIDYKTSSSTKGNCDELFYGEKVQIFVYAKALQNLFGLHPQGVFYLPILNKFEEEKKLPYMMRGKNVDDITFLNKMDTTLTFENPKSTIFPCELRTSKEAKASSEQLFKSSNNHVAKDDFESMMDYAIKMVENAIAEIINGNVEVNPNQSACEHCPYLSICQKNASQKIRGKNFKVDDPTFKNVLKGDEVNGY